MNNRLCYNPRYLSVKSIKKNGKVIGILTMVEKVYGIVIQLHYFDTPGYKINEIFTNPNKAYKYFNSVFETENNK